MTRGTFKTWTLIGLVVVVVSATAALHCRREAEIRPQSPRRTKVVYGISPYQDTILPYYAQHKGWYKEAGLDVELRVLAWGDVMPALGGGVDVAVQNFNSFQAAYWNIRARGREPLFYYPTFVFKGAAVIVPKDAGLTPYSDFQARGLTPADALRETLAQLRGKKIGVTVATEMEQLVTQAISRAGIDAKEFSLVNGQPDDNLNAFRAGSLAALSAGLTEQTAAARGGAYVLLSAADVLPPVIDGLVTTREFARAHPKELETLVDLWFRSVVDIERNFNENIAVLNGYLGSVGATQYTVDEYRHIWTNSEFFPRSRDEVARSILEPGARYFWRPAWEGNNTFLLNDKTIARPVPLEAFAPRGR